MYSYDQRNLTSHYTKMIHIHVYCCTINNSLETSHIDVQHNSVIYNMGFYKAIKKYEVTEFQRKQMKLETISLEKPARHG